MLKKINIIINKNFSYVQVLKIRILRKIYRIDVYVGEFHVANFSRV